MLASILTLQEGVITISNKRKKKKALKRESEYPHFRHYTKSGHPALILDSENGDYKFRRVTSAEKSGHHKNEKVEPNPDNRRKTPMYIVKAVQKDKKKAFSKWKYPWKYLKK